MVGKASWIKVLQRGATEPTWIKFLVAAQELGEEILATPSLGVWGKTHATRYKRMNWASSKKTGDTCVFSTWAFLLPTFVGLKRVELSAFSGAWLSCLPWWQPFQANSGCQSNKEPVLAHEVLDNPVCSPKTPQHGLFLFLLTGCHKRSCFAAKIFTGIKQPIFYLGQAMLFTSAGT